MVGPGALGSLTLSGCTVGGTVRVAEGAPSDLGVVVRLVRSECGPCVVRACRCGPAGGGLHDRRRRRSRRDRSQGASVGDRLHDPGAVAVHTLDASSTILDGCAVVENRQAGCLRYSYAPRGSRVPRRYRSSPSPTADPGTRPVYASTDRGSPSYLALASGVRRSSRAAARAAPRWGAPPPRTPAPVAAAARLLAPYLPVTRARRTRADPARRRRRKELIMQGISPDIRPRVRLPRRPAAARPGAAGRRRHAQADITAHHDEARARDMIGRSGGPAVARDSPGPFAVVGPSSTAATGWRFTGEAWTALRITGGSYYVDGVWRRAETPTGGWPLGDQPFLPVIPTGRGRRPGPARPGQRPLRGLPRRVAAPGHRRRGRLAAVVPLWAGRTPPPGHRRCGRSG